MIIEVAPESLIPFKRAMGRDMRRNLATFHYLAGKHFRDANRVIEYLNAEHERCEVARAAALRYGFEQEVAALLRARVSQMQDAKDLASAGSAR
jgi:hypothetical protein